jgi:hypothetical protein
MSSSFLSLQPSALVSTAPENNLQNTAAYSSAFPPLHSIPLAVAPTNKNKPWQSFYQPKPSLLPPKYPLYLRNTNYAKLADEQYHQQCRIKKASKPIGAISSLFHKSEPAVQYDAALEQLDLRLPCFWNPNDKSSLVDISSDGIDASYCGMPHLNFLYLGAMPPILFFSPHTTCNRQKKEIRPSHLFTLAASLAQKITLMPMNVSISFLIHSSFGSRFWKKRS